MIVYAVVDMRDALSDDRQNRESKGTEMFKKIGFTLLGTVIIAVAVSLVYGVFCALGYVGLMIPFFELTTDIPLFANGAIVAFSILMLVCVGCFLLLFACAAFKSGHFVGDRCVQLLRKVLRKQKQKLNSNSQTAEG